MTDSDRSFVIGISSVSGGGKTATAKKVVALLHDAVILSFDDYDNSNLHPENLPEWFQRGGDYNAWKTPTLTRDLQTLKSGNPITSVLDGSHISPARFIIFDAPLGRAHRDTGRFIDFMVFIDTPLDLALARRILRNLANEGPEGTSKKLESNLSDYVNEARPIYLHFIDQMKQTSDLILNGCCTLDELAMEIYNMLINPEQEM